MVFHCGRVLRRPLEQVHDDLERGLGGIDPGVLRHVLLEDVVLDRPLEPVDRHPLLLGRRDVEAEQHRGGTVDGHRGGDLVERDAVEQGLHVRQAGDRDPALAHLALGTRVVRVVAHEGGKVEGDREAGLAPLEQELVALVGILRGPEPGELPHGPEPPAVHRGVDAAGVGKSARQSEGGLRVGWQIERGVQRLDLAPRNRGELRVGAAGERRRLGAPGRDFGPQPLHLAFQLGSRRRHKRAPCLRPSSTSWATSYGLIRPSTTSSSRSLISCSAWVSLHIQRRAARSTTSRVRSSIRWRRRCSSVPDLRQPVVVPVERGDQLVDPVALGRHGEQDGVLPQPLRDRRALARAGRSRSARPVMRRHVAVRVPPPDAERHLDLVPQLIGARPVGLVHDEDVRGFHDAGLERLDAVARLGHQDQHGRVSHARDVELGLADADRLHHDPVEAGGVEEVGDFTGAGGESAERAAAGHRADVDALVQRDGFHADAVAEEGAAGKRAGRIHRDDTDAEARRAVGEHQALDQGGLPRPGGPVTPMRRARPSERWTPASSRSNPGRPFSTTEIARASATVLPAVRSASRRSGSMVERSPRTGGEASGSAAVTRTRAVNAGVWCPTPDPRRRTGCPRRFHPAGPIAPARSAAESARRSTPPGSLRPGSGGPGP